MTTIRRRAPRQAKRGRLISLEEFERKTPSYSCELIDGKIVRMSPVNFDHTLVAMTVSRILWAHVMSNDLGGIAASAGGYVYKIEPANVRAPDLAFLSHATIARAKKREGVFCRIPPDLAIEVRSPSNTWRKLERKCRDAIEAGSKATWIVDPKTRTVRVFSKSAADRLLAARDTITGGRALPGFRARVADFFADLPPQRR